MTLRIAFLSLLAILWNSTLKWVYLSFSPLPFTSPSSVPFVLCAELLQIGLSRYSVLSSWGPARSFPGSSAGKELACNARDPGSIPGEGTGYPLQCFQYSWASLVAQTVKRLSTMRETQVQSLDSEDPLEKETAIHSSTIAWKIPWTEEPGRLQTMGSQRVGHD